MQYENFFVIDFKQIRFLKSLQSNFFDSEINPFFSNSSLLPKTPIRGAFKLEKAFKDFGRVMSPVCMIRERFILLKI